MRILPILHCALFCAVAEGNRETDQGFTALDFAREKFGGTVPPMLEELLSGGSEPPMLPELLP